MTTSWVPKELLTGETIRLEAKWDSCFDVEITIPETIPHSCTCGVVHDAHWQRGEAWRCACGELWYADPAGRVWGTSHIKYAYETHGLFADLVEEAS